MIRKTINNLIRKLELKRIFPRGEKINIDETLIIGKYRSVNISGNSCFSVAENVYFRDFCSIMIGNNGNMKIGTKVFFNNYCSLNCMHDISIGDNSIFGEGVKIYDHNHKHNYTDRLIVSTSEYTVAPVIIGKNCWIGSNVIILKGVTVGDNVIIGANNLIIKSIKENCIVKAKTETSITNFDT